MFYLLNVCQQNRLSKTSFNWLQYQITEKNQISDMNSFYFVKLFLRDEFYIFQESAEKNNMLFYSKDRVGHRCYLFLKHLGF